MLSVSRSPVRIAKVVLCSDLGDGYMINTFRHACSKTSRYDTLHDGENRVEVKFLAKGRPELLGLVPDELLERIPKIPARDSTE